MHVVGLILIIALCSILSASELPATTIPPLPTKFQCSRVPMVTQKGNFCVPASAAMIAGFHGIKTDQDQIAQLSSKASISNEGTYPSDMSLAMGKLGLDGRTLLWKDEAEFNAKILPAIRRALIKTGPIYISFRPGVFGSTGHGCIIVGYDDRRQEILCYNPWGNEFSKDYSDVAVQGYGIVVFDPPRIAPTASDAFITQIQLCVPRFDGDFLTLANQLQKSKQSFELVWCSRRDSRNDKHFAVDTARRDGRKILELAFRRNPAVLIPASPNGNTTKYYFVTRPPQGGASYLVREITEQGWSDAALKTLGSLTRKWATALTVPGKSKPVWELPMIELHEAR
ncbi:MAG: C39 family peptidase [Opitutae bacterium]|nr:C39 family peptidase [Opitutae bacterium]